MKVIGLTGSIGMGKTAVALMLQDFGFPVYSADKAIHDILSSGGAAVDLVEKEFPGTKKKDGSIDRDLLGGIVFNDPQKLHKLEKIVHPLIKKAELDFLQEARRANVRAVVLEIPLLFETGADARCNITLCVAAPPAEQKARVLARPNMNEDKFLAVLERQMPNAEKCNLADYVVPTGVSLAETEDYLRSLFEKLGLMKKEP